MNYPVLLNIYVNIPGINAYHCHHFTGFLMGEPRIGYVININEHNLIISEVEESLPYKRFNCCCDDFPNEDTEDQASAEKLSRSIKECLLGFGWISCNEEGTPLQEEE